MTKEKKKALDFTDITYPKLLRFLHESKSNGYRTFNVVTNDGNLIYDPLIEVAISEDQIFISEDKIEELAQRGLDNRLGVLQQEK